MVGAVPLCQVLIHGVEILIIWRILTFPAVPTTPASTPPGNSINGMPYPTTQGYDASGRVYTAPPSQGQYPSQQMRFGGPLPGTSYAKTEMAPPPRAGEGEHGDVKTAHEDEADHDHDPEYTHTSASYNQAPSAYGYGAPPAAVSGEVHDPLSSSPHQNGSGRATPRTAASQQQWQGTYNAPQVMEPRGATGAPNGAYYPTQSFPSESLPPPNKRVRELDDEDGDDVLKRQKTGHEGGPVGGDNYMNRPRAAVTSRRR